MYNIKYIGNNVEIEFPEEISNKLDGEKLFLEIYTINSKFKMKYFNKKRLRIGDRKFYFSLTFFICRFILKVTPQILQDFYLTNTPIFQPFYL